MNRFLLAMSVFAAIAIAGCATRQYVPNQVAAKPELPISEIPDYPQPDTTFDVSSTISVYPTLWVSQPVAEALSKAGYKVVGASQDMKTREVVQPDFVVVPLTFRHWTEGRSADTWLFTRLVLQVRKPVRVANGETELAPSPEPRVFQVYAKRSIRSGVTPNEALYRANMADAVGNLMRVPEFRKALERDR